MIWFLAAGVLYIVAVLMTLTAIGVFDIVRHRLKRKYVENRLLD